MPIKTNTITLLRSELISPYVKELEFEYEGDSFKQFTPGQFITLHFYVGENKLMRSYSIATQPGATSFSFAAGYVEGGPATELLFNLKPGEQLQAAGPYGRLVLRDEQPKRYILMATSTGVTPYRAMLTELLQRLEQQPQLSVVVVLGVQHRADLIYADDFLAAAQKQPRFEFRAQYSREQQEDLSHDYEHVGYVQNAFEELAPDAANDIVYLCGNPQMIDNCFEQLTHIGFDAKNVRREKYLSK